MSDSVTKKTECQGQSRFGACFSRASVEREGKHYCWRHDPVRMAAIAAKKWEERKLEIAEIERKQDARIERRKLEAQADVVNLSDAELKTIAQLGGIRTMIARLEEL